MDNLSEYKTPSLVDSYDPVIPTFTSPERGG